MSHAVRLPPRGTCHVTRRGRMRSACVLYPLSLKETARDIGSGAVAKSRACLCLRRCTTLVSHGRKVASVGAGVTGSIVKSMGLYQMCEPESWNGLQCRIWSCRCPGRRCHTLPCPRGRLSCEFDDSIPHRLHGAAQGWGSQAIRACRVTRTSYVTPRLELLATAAIFQSVVELGKFGSSGGWPERGHAKEYWLSASTF